MVKPAFENIDVDLWGHPGKLGITQPSVCLFHGTRDSGAQILNAIAELGADARPAQRTLTFSRCSRPGALRKMRINRASNCDDLKILHISHDHDTATIIMTDVGLSLLTSAFQSWLGGSEDFGVSPRHSVLKPKAFGKLDKESGELWFWGPGFTGP